MAIYYIDAVNGSNSNDGLSENTPLADCSAANVCAGDSVLFKRGTVTRKKIYSVEGTREKPVTYGAYGKGDLPIITASVNLSEKELWVECKKNIWTVEGTDPGEAANFVFDGGKSYGTLRWNIEDMCSQGDFFDTGFGVCTQTGTVMPGHKIYLYSIGNPAEVYDDIECVIYGERNLADNGSNLIFRDLHFMNGGVHAIAGEGTTVNMRVINCLFENIGGAVWNKDLKIRFGNAVEAWDIGDDVEVHGCCFNNIYDTAVTHQGGANCKPCKNFIVTDNVFIKCGMASYEQRDRLPEFAQFNKNICIDAGEGFSKQGEVMPRRSEIWPQPMGHHVFAWRIESADGGCMEVKDNIFYNAPYGAAIYSICSREADDLMKIEGNTYYTENRALLNHIYGKSFKDFDEYKDIEPNCKYDNLDIDKILKAWEDSKK